MNYMKHEEVSHDTASCIESLGDTMSNTAQQPTRTDGTVPRERHTAQVQPLPAPANPDGYTAEEVRLMLTQQQRNDTSVPPTRSPRPVRTPIEKANRKSNIAISVALFALLWSFVLPLFSKLPHSPMWIMGFLLACTVTALIIVLSRRPRS
jgi:hypothetical protein